MDSSSSDCSLEEKNVSVTYIAEVGEPPNGGHTAWLQVLAAFFSNFSSWGVVNAFGVYQDYYQKTLLSANTPFQISWIMSLSGSMTFFATNFFGFLIDMGYIKYMAFISGILQFVALLLLSFCKTYAEVILTQGLLVGCSSALMFLISVNAVAPYFSTKRPFAIGLGASGSSIGGTIYSVMARKLGQQLSFGWSTRIIAFVQLATSAVMFLCVKRRLPPKKRTSLIAFECFKEPVTLIYAIGNVFAYLSIYTFYVYYECFAISKVGSDGVFSYMTAIVNAGSMMGRIVPSLIATMVGPFNVTIVSEVLSMVLTFCWIKATNKGGIIVVGLLFGLVSGSLMALPGTVVTILTKDMSRLGIRLSFMFSFMAVGVVLGPPIAGMIERQYGYFWLQMYAGLSWVVCLMCHVIVRIMVGGTKLSAKV